MSSYERPIPNGKYSIPCCNNHSKATRLPHSMPAPPPAMQLHHLPCLILLPLAVANVEKTIFVGPAETTLPNDGPGLSNLCLESLAPPREGSEITKLRTLLPVQFPTTERANEVPKGFRGLQSWYILKDLKAGQRYEVRICWSATVSCCTMFTGFYVKSSYAVRYSNEAAI